MGRDGWKCYSKFHLALANGVLSSIKDNKSEKEIWDHLARLYKARSLQNKKFLKRKLYALRMTESTSVTEHNRRNNREDRQTSSRQVEALVVTRGRSMEPGSSGSHNHGKSKTGKKKNFKCFKCGKSGHFRKDCRGVANESRKRFADVWLFDTGTTFHMTVRREWFHQYKRIFGGGSVYSCNDHELKIIGIGSIMVKMHDGTVRTIRDVQHVKGLKKNLLSLGQLVDLGCKVEIQNKIMKIIKGALVLMKGEKKLGHMSEQGMKIVVERKLLAGLTKVSLPFCEHCVISKQHRLKFKTSNSRSVYVLELVHSDVWKALVLSLGGANYFVSIIDDYSRRCWVYLIKKKSDVFEVFKVYKARVELDSGKKIKCLRTDNGGEYTGDEFDTFCRKEGIKRQFTTAYTPQQNGVAERMNRTLLERARAMFGNFELKTPMEMWTGKPVNYSDLHIFRSHVYMMYNTQETTKLDPKSRKCLFLGYADGVKGYRLWDLTAHKVVISRDVFFMEDKIQENEEGDSTTKETTSIQMENEFQSNYSSEAVPQHEVNEMTKSQALTTRTSDHERKSPKEAMQEEIEALHKNKTWELVPLPGGYAQKEGINFNKIFSPVVRMTTIRVVLAMCATYDLHLEQLDVKTAFLHGNLEEEIYTLQPEGFKQKRKENLVCRLNKSLYDLKQAPRCWYKRFDTFIRSLEYNRLHANPCAYFKRFRNNDFIILLLYVDDVLVAGPNKDRINKLKAQLAREFKMKDIGPTNKILGMEIHRDRVSRKIWLSQKSYVKKILQRFNMQDCKPISTSFPTDVKLSSKMSPSSEKERMEMSRVSYASAVGSLMFVMICTRPDIAHAVGVVSRYMAKPGRGHWEALKRILRYVKGTLDVSLCDLDRSKSTTGYVFTLSGGTVSWVSKLQSVVAMSTTEAEYVAVAQASKEAVWLKMLLEELGHKQEKITLFCDNQSALYLARNPAFHSKTKHIRVQYHFIREKVEEGTVDMQKIHTDDNVADYLTKAINGDKFIWCRSSCGLAET
ncbi:retrovirus-related pol polyprotein from transposon TNT 1-94 [Tanacetum coccineum]